MAAVWDPAAVRRWRRPASAPRVTLQARRPHRHAVDRAQRGAPLEVTGRVRTLTDGEWIVRGPMYTGVTVTMGPTAVLDTGKVQIVVVSRHHEPWDHRRLHQRRNRSQAPSAICC